MIDTHSNNHIISTKALPDAAMTWNWHSASWTYLQYNYWAYNWLSFYCVQSYACQWELLSPKDIKHGCKIDFFHENFWNGHVNLNLSTETFDQMLEGIPMDISEGKFNFYVWGGAVAITVARRLEEIYWLKERCVTQWNWPFVIYKNEQISILL